MKKSVLTFTPIPADPGAYHAAFRNNHGRKIYLAIRINNRICSVKDCHYIDRSSKKVPKNLTKASFSYDMLANKICRELDKPFARIDFLNDILFSKAELIHEFLSSDKKHILLMLKDGCYLRTIFKNRYHRSIYLKIKLLYGEAEIDEAVILDCRYCDVRSGERNSPHGLNTVFFHYSLDNVLHIVNNELEGGFSDIAIAEEHNLTLNRPICGRT